MKWNWRKILTGIRVAANVAIDLNDAHLIKVKELDRVKTVRDIVQRQVPRIPHPAPGTQPSGPGMQPAPAPLPAPWTDQPGPTRPSS